jgi:hypothetical protein
MSANKIKMSVSNKIPEVSFFKFLKHAKAILQNPLPFHAKNFDTLGDIFRLKLVLKICFVMLDFYNMRFKRIKKLY